MECSVCKSPNPDENRFCGMCGGSLTEQITDVQAFLRDSLQKQIDESINLKLAAFTSHEIVEVKATEQVIDRAWKWMTRFGTIVGIPVAIVTTILTVIVAILSFIGWGSVEDLGELRLAAEEKFSSAIAKADEIDKRATIAAAEFDGKMKAIDDHAKNAEEALRLAETSRARIEKAVNATDKMATEIAIRLKSFENDFSLASNKLDDLEQIGARIPEIERDIQKVDRLQEEVNSLSGRVKANELIRNAIEEKKADRQIEIYTRAIDFDRNYEIIYNNRGISYYNNGEYDLALSDFSRAIEIDPEYSQAYVNRSAVHIANRHYELGLEDAKKAIDLDPEYAVAHRNMGSIYRSLGNHHDALRSYDRSINLDPGDVRAYVGRAQTYLDLDRPDDAAIDFDTALEFDPDSDLAYRGRGRSMFGLGKFLDAERDFSKSVRLNPSNGYAVIWSYLARARGGNSEKESLRSDAGRLDAEKWPYPIVLMFLGEFSPIELKNTVRGEIPIEQQSQLCEVEFYTGQLHMIEGNEAEAIRLFNKALSICPDNFIEHYGARSELKRMK